MLCDCCFSRSQLTCNGVCLHIHVCAHNTTCTHTRTRAHTCTHTVHGLLQQFDGHLITDVFSLLWLVSAAQSTQDKYAIYICSQPGMLTHLNSAMTLEQVNEKYWKINKPMEMFYLDTTKAQELAMKKNPPTGIPTVDKWRGMGSPSSLDKHLLKLHYGVGGGGVDLCSSVAAALQVYSMRLGTDGQHCKGDWRCWLVICPNE